MERNPCHQRDTPTKGVWAWLVDLKTPTMVAPDPEKANQSHGVPTKQSNKKPAGALTAPIRKANKI